jgi:hypothetical protein
MNLQAVLEGEASSSSIYSKYLGEIVGVLIECKSQYLIISLMHEPKIFRFSTAFRRVYAFITATAGSIG